MKVFIALIFLFVLAIAWAVLVRPWMRKQQWAKGFFETIEPIERAIYRKSESIFFGRFLAGMGVLVSSLIQFGSIDLTPITPFLPDGFKWIPTVLPLFVSVLGIVQEMLRRDTTVPLEVISMRTDAPPAVQAAAADARATSAAAADAVNAANAN